MAAHVIDVTDASFTDEILQSDVPAIVDFWAEWCGPCKAIAPYVEALAEEHQGQIKVAKLNIDHNPQVATSLRIQSIPTLIAFKNGEVIGQLRGPRRADLAGFFSDTLTA